MSALERQVGGGWYVKLAIQPVEFAMLNGLDACAFSILKYVTRYRDKAGLQDLDKAIHFFELRCTVSGAKPLAEPKITFEDYCAANNITGTARVVLTMLGEWLQGYALDTHMKNALAALREDYVAEEARS